MTEVVVADASPLIVLARIGHLKTLVSVVGRVIVPDVVLEECVGKGVRPGAIAIEDGFNQGWLTRQPQYLRPEPISAVGLGPGESEAIAIAVALNIPLLIDERLGRQVALMRKLQVIGTMGVLLKAKEQGLVDSMRATLESLGKVGFFVAPALLHEVLRRAGESNESS